MNKLAAMEKFRDTLEKHFNEFQHPIMIPYIADVKFNTEDHYLISSFEPVIESYRITFEDWYNFNKVKFYRQDFEDLIKED